MRKIALALTALIAMSGSVLAKDVAATLPHPNSDAGVKAPVVRKNLDYSSTSSIKRETASGVVSPRYENGETGIPAAKAAPSGIEINPWIVPSFH